MTFHDLPFFGAPFAWIFIGWTLEA